MGRNSSSFGTIRKFLGATHCCGNFNEGIDIQLNDLARGSDSYLSFSQRIATINEQDTITVYACEMVYNDPEDGEAQGAKRNLLTVARRWKKNWDNRLKISLDIPDGVCLKTLAETLSNHHIPIPDALHEAIKKSVPRPKLKR
jgi:hypothetical protein